MPTDIRKIKKLIELLETSGIAEIEIKEGEDSVRISRHAHASASLTMPPIWAAPGYGPPMAGPMSAAPPAAPPAPAAEAETPGHVLRSPMVGTFYRSAAPGSGAARAVVYNRLARPPYTSGAGLPKRGGRRWMHREATAWDHWRG